MKKQKNNKKKVNWLVIIYSILGFAFIALSFLIDWMFIIGAVAMMLLNQRELNKK